MGRIWEKAGAVNVTKAGIKMARISAEFSTCVIVVSA
jgi:hypothetical protein